MEGAPVRYALVVVKDEEVFLRYDGMPSVVYWPNGEATHCPAVGDERGGVRLVSVEHGGAKPHQFCTKGPVEKKLDGSTLTLTQTFVPDPLENVIAGLSHMIDQRAEQERLGWIKGVGQAMTYEHKKAEAISCLAGDRGEFPLLSADGRDPKEVASEVLKAATEWSIAEARIESLRMRAKRTLQKADSIEEAIFLSEAVPW